MAWGASERDESATTRNWAVLLASSLPVTSTSQLALGSTRTTAQRACVHLLSRKRFWTSAVAPSATLSCAVCTNSPRPLERAKVTLKKVAWWFQAAGKLTPSPEAPLYSPPRNADTAATLPANCRPCEPPLTAQSTNDSDGVPVPEDASSSM
eukprot:m51a1_g12713 hypothetical protein (152) ;mRNA; r:201-884